jgi:hypothetical protein
MQARCQCGALSATIAQDADAMTVLCHCLDCQRRSGSPFGVMAYFPADAVVIEGEATRYERRTDGGNTFTNGFCSVSPANTPTSSASVSAQWRTPTSRNRHARFTSRAAIPG